MNCKYCGADIPEGSAVCEYCGSSLVPEPETAPAQEAVVPEPEAPVQTPYSPAPELSASGEGLPAKPRKKHILLKILGAAAIVAVVFLLVAISSAPQRNAVKYIKYTMETCYNKPLDVDTYLAFFPQEFVKKTAEELSGSEEQFRKELREYFDKSYEDVKDLPDNQKDILHDVKSVKTEKLKRSEVDELKDKYGIKIDGAVRVYLEAELTRNGERDPYEGQLIMLRIGTKWYVDPEWFLSLF